MTFWAWGTNLRRQGCANLASTCCHTNRWYACESGEWYLILRRLKNMKQSMTERMRVKRRKRTWKKEMTSQVALKISAAFWLVRRTAKAGAPTLFHGALPLTRGLC